MAASRGHPILERIIDNVVKSFHRLARHHATSIHQLEPSDEEVTGPSIWASALMESLSEATRTNMSYVNMTGMKEPTLLGDILILSNDGLTVGERHPSSTRDGDQLTTLISGIYSKDLGSMARLISVFSYPRGPTFSTNHPYHGTRACAMQRLRR